MLRHVRAIAAFGFLIGCGSTTPAPELAKKAKSSPVAQPAGDGAILRLTEEMKALAPEGVRIERAATGFQFTEGPLWFKETGALWFSDVQGNVIRERAADGAITEILKPGGYDGADAPDGAFVGPNGLAFDAAGNVLICQHGNRRIARRSKAGVVTTLVDRYQGKRLNSPNDMALRSDGSIYFTDPPYGLLKQDDDPAKELAFSGVYRLDKGKLTLVHQEMTRPNGIALSPDERWLYVANSDEKRKIWMRFRVEEDGSLSGGRVFADVTGEKEPGLPDGLKVDGKGNVWATGPGGVWVFNSEGKHLGTIKPKEVPANCAFAEDGTVLWMTARTSLYRVKLK